LRISILQPVEHAKHANSVERKLSREINVRILCSDFDGVREHLNQPHP
jgi:hypothetical protein